MNVFLLFNVDNVFSFMKYGILSPTYRGGTLNAARRTPALERSYVGETVPSRGGLHSVFCRRPTHRAARSLSLVFTQLLS